MYLDITNAHDQLISKDGYATTKVIKDTNHLHIISTKQIMICLIMVIELSGVQFGLKSYA